MLSISVLIPLIGYKEITNTIQSVIHQKYEDCEILILRNNISDLPENSEVREIHFDSLFIREILIKEKGKGNALNEGIKRASGDVIVVVDADCILDEYALINAMKHFEKEEVVAVGGRLLVMKQNGSLLERIQNYEYMKTFEFSRRIFSVLNAQCLISGAFGLFRKSTLTEVGGYDTDTVGEDMELVLRIQDNGLFKTNKKIVYEPKAVCYTGVPHNFIKLLYQRDRWQRGLIDALLKHKNMIFNPFYGLLGIFTLVYQLMFELLGPIWYLLYCILPRFKEILPNISYWGLLYILFQFVLSIFASFLESDNKPFQVIKKLPRLAILTVICIFYQMIIILARFYGIITYHWRRLEW